MSKIDLSNPKVLNNYITSQIKEGNGKLFWREKVLCFENVDGFTCVAPDEAVAHLSKSVKQEPAAEAKEVVVEAKEPVVVEVVEPENEEFTKDELQAALQEKGIEFDKRWGVEKLKSLLN